MEYKEIEPRVIGKRIINVNGLKENSERVRIYFEDGSKLEMYHEQDCCESVYLLDFDNDVSVLKFAKLLSIEEAVEDGNSRDGSSTWTFYKLTTDKGRMTMRWYGESNGYYSENVTVTYYEKSKYFGYEKK